MQLEVPINSTQEEIKNIYEDEIKFLREFLMYLEQNEGIEQSVYLDTKRKLTIGIGKNIDLKKNFISVPFYWNAGRKLTIKEKEELFDRFSNLRDIVVKTLKKPFRHSEYGKIYISEDWAREDAIRYLLLDLPLLKNKLRKNEIEYDFLPKTAKFALLDLQYNLGNFNFNSEKWPNLFDALKDKDFSKAALESHRSDVNYERNKMVSDWFIYADAKFLE